MKKLLASAVILLMLTSTFAGCGSKSKPAENTSPQAKTSDSSSSEKTPDKETPSKETPGTELSNFMTDYINAKSKCWDAMSKKFEDEQNLAFAMGSLGFAFADLAIVDIALFDALTVKDGDSFKGKLMFSNIDAWKKVKGDIIEFGYDFVYKEDKNNYKNGDHEITTGKFDKKNSSLYYERTTERNNKKVSRSVIEIVKNSSTSYSSQILFLGSLDNSSDNSLNGYLTWFDGENISSILTEKKNIDVSFTYNSIINKKNLKPEEMVGNMDVITKASFIDGKASFQDLQAN